MSTTAHAEGAGSIAVGGDVINSIFVTGGVNQFFVGRYERLAEAYLNPRALYRELRMEHFTGRDWLLRALDDFIAAHDRGYVVIEAEAGMGKTAFMAWLARERGYVHHFVRLMPDADDAGVALRNLSAQLIRAWELQSMAVGGVLPANASRPDFFEEVLYEAALRRDELRPGEPIVLVVDGLNETAAPATHNPLGLPADLPEGVFVVVSQRTVMVPLMVETPRRVLRIRRDAPENLADLKAYTGRLVAEPVLAARLEEAGIEPGEYVRRLVSWSSGVWLVLRYVLAELRSGARAPGDLESLPVGLWHYYARFWSRWQRAHESTWATVDLPLLVTITAAQEPLTLDVLCLLSECPDPERAARLVGDDWRPFLQVDGEGERERYRTLHDSLGEFVAGRVDAGGLTSAERPFVERLAVAQRDAHERIAARYLDAWGGLEASLPALRASMGTGELDGGYGLRHVVHHLAAAETGAALHALLAVEWPRDEAADPGAGSGVSNAWFEAHRARNAYAGYVLDVQRAWAHAERTGALDLELRYALIEASVNSMAGNVPSELLLAQVDDGLLSTEQALELARETTEPRTRAEALATLLPRLTGETRREVVREALASVQLVPDGYWRAGELVRLAPVTGPEHRDDLVAIASNMSRAYDRDISMRFLEAYFENPENVTPGPDPETFFSDPDDPRLFAAQYLRRTAHAVATLLLGTGIDPSEETDLRRHVEASRFVPDPRWRAGLLTVLAGDAPPEARRDILRVALGVALGIGDGEAVDAAQAAIAARLAGAGDVAAALEHTERIDDPEGLARALFAVADRVPPAERRPIALRAVAATEAIADPVARGRVLRDHAAHLAAHLDGDLDGTLASLPPDWRASVRAAVPGAASGDELLDLIASVPGPGRGRVLAELILRLPDSHLDQARDAIGTLDDSEERDHALAVLAPRLPAGADEADAIADAYWRMETRFQVACALAENGRPDEAARIAERVDATPRRAEALAAAGRTEAAFGVADGLRDDPAGRIAVLLRVGARGAGARKVGAREDGAPEERGRDAVAEAVAALDEIAEPRPRAVLTAPVALALAESGRAEEALDLVRSLPGDERAAPLTPLAPIVGPPALDLARTLPDPVARAQVLALLTGHASDVPGHLREVLRALATGTREQLLQAVPDILTGLLETAGPRGLSDLAAAVALVRRWWP
ncbi:hypothetical protein Acsp03_46680 [Actinomadura sp. NBRC 104412]|uniref:hypothetical protein n=1 Tax=Actinomadura sp. NBRC 104412 TaxID=3032203 RepID=UPI0024A510C6|nr:hypothetical protein [Actinomadura sp. NBRC 104412]GLZ07202.1 hypothetical protein Acsp03_46680 [Actinomadura sp. NBRC 104412]